MTLFLLYFLYVAKYWSGAGTPRHSNEKSIPFMFTIKIPSPLKRGIDYGFKRALKFDPYPRNKI